MVSGVGLIRGDGVNPPLYGDTYGITIQLTILSLKRDFFYYKIVFHYKYEKPPSSMYDILWTCVWVQVHTYVHVYTDHAVTTHTLCHIETGSVFWAYAKNSIFHCNAYTVCHK